MDKESGKCTCGSKWGVVLLVIVVAVIAGGVGYMWQDSRAEKESASEEKVVEDNSEKKSTTEEIDHQFNMYTNYKLGFSLHVPKKGQNVKGEDKDVKVVEGGNIAYLDQGLEDYDSGKKHADIISGSGSDFEKLKSAFMPWAIVVKEVKNDEEITKFFQDRYGEGCKMDSKKVNPQQPGTYDVFIGSSNDKGFWEEGGCPINFALNTKYYPEKNLIVNWDIGQDTNFREYYDDGTIMDGNDLDNEMIRSFRFLD